MMAGFPLANWRSGSVPTLIVRMNLISSFPKRSRDYALGISEHVFQMSEGHPLLEHMPQEGPLLTFATYTTHVYTAAQQLQFDVRLGLEVDFIPEKNEHIQALLQGHDWDFLIGSVHEINGERFEVDKKWSREQGEPSRTHAR